MKCSEFEKLEMKYMDGNITDEEMKKMREHTEECSSCREELALYGAMLENMQKIPVPVPSDSFTAEVMKGVEQLPQRSKGLMFLVVCSVVSALSSIAGVLNLAVLNRAELVEVLSSDSMLKPFVGLINLLAAADELMGELLTAVFAVLELYKDSLTFGALAVAIIVLGIYAALNKKAIGGAKK